MKMYLDTYIDERVAPLFRVTEGPSPSWFEILAPSFQHLNETEGDKAYADGIIVAGHKDQGFFDVTTRFGGQIPIIHPYWYDYGHAFGVFSSVLRNIARKVAEDQTPRQEGRLLLIVPDDEIVATLTPTLQSSGYRGSDAVRLRQA